MLTLKQGSELVKLARKAIETAFKHKEPESSKIQKYSAEQGVFVTLHMFPSRELRGCIGFTEPLPLGKAIVGAARAAAFSDPRFSPLEESELKRIIIEISVLTSPKEIKSNGGRKKDIAKDIVIGKDGLIVSLDNFSGLLLPQVAIEQKWDSLEFLEYACLKAGLGGDSWKKENCKVYTFQAQIFSEAKPKGKIEQKDY